MSSNYTGEESSNHSYYVNQGFDDNEESFTDLQSCDLHHNADSSDEDSTPAKHTEQPMTTVDSGRLINDIEDLIREDLYKFIFAPISKQWNSYLTCRLRRFKFDMFHTFHFEIERENGQGPLNLLTAEKASNIAGPTQYIISVEPKFSSENYSIELQSTNLTGTSYTLYDRTGLEHQQLAAILYESNFLGLKGPRKIEVSLPRFNNAMQSIFDEDDIAQYNSQIKDDSSIHLRNKPPVCNPYTGDYVLNFNRSHHMIQPSIKNFQMVIENDEGKEEIVMQFGRMADNEFFCDFSYPLSLIQAFGIALSAFDSRLFRD